MVGADRVIVVGGGVAGLVAARQLALAAREVIVLEAADRLGGQLTSHSVAGIRLDAGADEFSLRGDAMHRLLDALRLTDDIEHPAAASMRLRRADGSTASLPAMTLLGIPGVPLARDVIAAVGMRAALRAQLDGLMPGLVAAKAGTLAELVRRRMGRGVLDGLVAPVAHGVHGVPPEQLEAEDVLPGIRGLMLSRSGLASAVQLRLGVDAQGTPVASLRGGLLRLVDALVDDLARFGVEVRTATEVVAVERTGVTTAAGERLRGEVVLAAPLGVEAPRTRGRLVTIALDAPELSDAASGMGVYVAPGAPDVAAHALTNLTVRWSWLTASAGPQLLRLAYAAGVEGTPERAHRDAEVLLGRTLPPPVDGAVVEWDRPGRRSDAPHAIDGMRRVGEADSGTGLAAVVAAAMAVADDSPSAAPGREG